MPASGVLNSSTVWRQSRKTRRIAYLQPNRVAQRLIGNFSFTVAQRSFDGVDGHYGQGSWDITAMAGRADQGVFNMNGNPELNVDIQYLAYTKSDWQDRFLWRVFAIGYHDGRTGITKTDNRPLAVRQQDHQNIRIGTYGGDFITAHTRRAGAIRPAGMGCSAKRAVGISQPAFGRLYRRRRLPAHSRCVDALAARRLVSRHRRQ